MELRKEITNKEKRQYYKERAFERLGETRINTMGSKMTIIDYKNCDNITVQFENGYITQTVYDSFKRGFVKNVYDKSKYGIGYLGDGKYKATVNGVHTPQYIAWNGIFSRCYSQKQRNRYPSYKDCYVCKEWLNFQNFAKWYDENYYKIGKEKMDIDKDILVKGNKVYSPLTCIFVPQNINNLFTKSNAIRGKFPIGVSKNQRLYKAACRNGKNVKVELGLFNTPHEAFMVYKEYKEKLIKEIANKYRNRIPEKLYNAMMNYEVSEED